MNGLSPWAEERQREINEKINGKKVKEFKIEQPGWEHDRIIIIFEDLTQLNITSYDEFREIAVIGG
jgi:hypothetical protein